MINKLMDMQLKTMNRFVIENPLTIDNFKKIYHEYKLWLYDFFKEIDLKSFIQENREQAELLGFRKFVFDSQFYTTYDKRRLRELDNINTLIGNCSYIDDIKVNISNEIEKIKSHYTYYQIPAYIAKFLPEDMAVIDLRTNEFINIKDIKDINDFMDSNEYYVEFGIKISEKYKSI